MVVTAAARMGGGDRGDDGGWKQGGRATAARMVAESRPRPHGGVDVEGMEGGGLQRARRRREAGGGATAATLAGGCGAVDHIGVDSGGKQEGGVTAATRAAGCRGERHGGDASEAAQ